MYKINWVNIIVFLFSLGTLVTSIILLNKINKCKKDTSAKNTMLVGMDIQVDPKDLDAPTPSQDVISKCNDALKNNQGMYYCIDSDKLIDPSSDDVCLGAAAIVPDDFGGSNCAPYRGSCSRPLKATYNPSSGNALSNYICTTLPASPDNSVYPIFQTNCSGGGMKKAGVPCPINPDLDLPPCVGFCS
jgi:hypothetical protein